MLRALVSAATVLCVSSGAKANEMVETGVDGVFVDSANVEMVNELPAEPIDSPDADAADLAHSGADDEDGWVTVSTFDMDEDAPPTNPGDRGYNSRIDWHNDLNAALAKAKQQDKPAMVLFHSDASPDCIKLKGDFEVYSDIWAMSRDFVMVNLEGMEDVNAGDEYRPDGAYLPRIFFVDGKTGLVQTQMINELAPSR